MSLTYRGGMAEPEVTVQCFHLGALDHTDAAVLSDALSDAVNWMEEEALAYGIGMAIIVNDLSRCPNRVDQTHQPIPSQLAGSTLTYSCSDCTYSGTMTVGSDPTALTWVNP